MWACTPSTTTFIWAGDQLLWELKEASGTYAAAAGGNVGYFHAGGIDRPLVITKNGESIVPHQNWRGQFARGTYADGPKVGQRSDCTSYPPSGCTPIQWPGERTTARHELEPDNNIQNWFGSLVDDIRDASGQMYRRNRYYDPQTGQFTQPDPIGLAGGLNAYAFAEGDPVSYGDPYGLASDGGCDNPQGKSEKSACKTADKLKPWRPVLTAGYLYVQAMSIFAGGGAGLGTVRGLSFAAASTTVTNPVPRTLVRVVDAASFTGESLGRPGAVDVFVTDAAALRGLSALQVAEKLAIPPPTTSQGFTLVEFFPSAVRYVASPVARAEHSLFRGGGLTAGGAPEFVVPNGPIPVNANIYTVGVW